MRLDSQLMYNPAFQLWWSQVLLAPLLLSQAFVKSLDSGTSCEVSSSSQSTAGGSRHSWSRSQHRSVTEKSNQPRSCLPQSACSSCALGCAPSCWSSSWWWRSGRTTSLGNAPRPARALCADCRQSGWFGSDPASFWDIYSTKSVAAHEPIGSKTIWKSRPCTWCFAAGSWKHSIIVCFQALPQYWGCSGAQMKRDPGELRATLLHLQWSVAECSCLCWSHHVKFIGSMTPS